MTGRGNRVPTPESAVAAPGPGIASVVDSLFDSWEDDRTSPVRVRVAGREAQAC
jgi:hypothetical protein